MQIGAMKIGVQQKGASEIGAMQVNPVQIRLLSHFPAGAHPGLVTLNNRFKPCR